MKQMADLVRWMRPHRFDILQTVLTDASDRMPNEVQMNSAAVAAHVSRYEGIAERKIAVVCNGVETMPTGTAPTICGDGRQSRDLAGIDNGKLAA